MPIGNKEKKQKYSIVSHHGLYSEISENRNMDMETLAKKKRKRMKKSSDIAQVLTADSSFDEFLTERETYTDIKEKGYMHRTASGCGPALRLQKLLIECTLSLIKKLLAENTKQSYGEAVKAFCLLLKSVDKSEVISTEFFYILEQIFKRGGDKILLSQNRLKCYYQIAQKNKHLRHKIFPLLIEYFLNKEQYYVAKTEAKSKMSLWKLSNIAVCQGVLVIACFAEFYNNIMNSHKKLDSNIIEEERYFSDLRINVRHALSLYISQNVMPSYQLLDIYLFLNYNKIDVCLQIVEDFCQLFPNEFLYSELKIFLLHEKLEMLIHEETNESMIFQEKEILYRTSIDCIRQSCSEGRILDLVCRGFKWFDSKQRFLCVAEYIESNPTQLFGWLRLIEEIYLFEKNNDKKNVLNFFGNERKKNWIRAYFDYQCCSTDLLCAECYPIMIFPAILFLDEFEMFSSFVDLIFNRYMIDRHSLLETLDDTNYLYQNNENSVIDDVVHSFCCYFRETYDKDVNSVISIPILRKILTLSLAPISDVCF